MVQVEYVGGLPGRKPATPVGAAVEGDTLRLKRGQLFGGWSYRVPLAAITSAESATAREVLAASVLAAGEAARLDQPHERLLLIAVSPDDHPATIVLRGPWAALCELREAILRGRMRAARQWHP